VTLRIACTYDLAGLDALGHALSAGASVGLVILPELCDGGYERLQRERGPRRDIGDLLSRFAEFSREHQTTLIAGSVAFPESDGRVYNMSLVFVRGELAGRFPKTHLFRPLADDQYFTPGRPGEVLTLPDSGPRVGVIICYDLRFPETVRPWFKAGLDLLCVPARWPRVRDNLWQALLRARAIENQCFVIGVDSRDEEGGGSYAFSPLGETVFSLGPDPEHGEMPWHRFEIDLEEIASVRSKLDTRADARLL